MKKNILIPLIWLLIYPIVIPAPLSNYVLCIGADGHVEFEIEANGRCTDFHPSHLEHAEVMFTEPTLLTDHCGSCIDLPIFFSLDEQPHLIPPENIPLNQLISSVALETNRTHASAILSSAPHLGSSPFGYPLPVFLCTIPLLI